MNLREKQNTSIAKACGWTEIGWQYSACYGYKTDAVLSGKPPGKPYVQAIPDYFTDVNAMQEAVKSLTYEQAEEFVLQLFIIVVNEIEQMDNPPPIRFAEINATAEQRAEALLSTLQMYENT